MASLPGFGWAAGFVVACLILEAAPALAQDTGRASATASDSLTLNGRAYQLFGIDGFEFNQSCFIDGQPLACGVSATRALQTLLDPAAVTCTAKGASAMGTTLATCIGHDEDIALRLVEQGWALADRSQADDYAAAEEAARNAKVGAWRGTFLTPSAYREQRAAIEASYAARAGESARAEAEAAITTNGLDLRGLEEITVESLNAAAEGAVLESYEVHFDEFRPGFVDAAISPPDIFTWKAVAGALETTRRQGIEQLKESVADAIWDELAARPSETIDTRNEESFRAALKERSAGWIAEGRQPILYVMAQDLPNWIRGWFAGQAPAGADVSRREDRTNPNYLGTIDGIDVYVGPGRERASLLVPSDVLSELTFQKDAEGRVLALEAGAEKNAWVARFSMALSWRDDTLVWLAFPLMASPTPDAV